MGLFPLYHLFEYLSLNKERTKNLSEIRLQDGDLVFRQGRSMESYFVLAADRSATYSHVGIVYKMDNENFVIHAVPGESRSGLDYVKCEKLPDFLEVKKARQVAVYRLNTEQAKTTAAKASKKGHSYFEKNLLFDDRYDLRSDTKLYCTELVWKAFLAAGIDLTEGSLSIVNVPLIKKEIILPGIFINSTLLTKIYEF